MVEELTVSSPHYLAYIPTFWHPCDGSYFVTSVVIRVMPIGDFSSLPMLDLLNWDPMAVGQLNQFTSSSFADQQKSALQCYNSIKFGSM